MRRSAFSKNTWGSVRPSISAAAPLSESPDRLHAHLGPIGPSPYGMELNRNLFSPRKVMLECRKPHLALCLVHKTLSSCPHGLHRNKHRDQTPPQSRVRRQQSPEVGSIMTSNCSHKDWLGLVADAADRGDRTTDCPLSQANHITFLAKEAVLQNPSFVEELAKIQIDSSVGTLFNVLDGSCRICT